MGDFTISYYKTARNEGGYANDPADKGGETWKGIARKMHPDWMGWAIVDLYRKDKRFPAILNTIETLDAAVRKFYKAQFWDRIRGHEILFQGVADSIYDNAVNMGTSAAIKLAQRSLKIPETGRMDDYTLSKLNNK